MDECAAGLRVAVVSCDERELRVVGAYLKERSPDFRCSFYRAGEPLLDALCRGEALDAVILGIRPEDMDEGTFLTRLYRLRRSPALLFLSAGRHERASAASLSADGTGYFSHQRSLEELLGQLRGLAGDRTGRIEQACLSLYRRWGIPQPKSNCIYLTRALCAACASPERLAVRKEILQTAAGQCGVSVSAVDSGLRRLIDELETRQPPAWAACKREMKTEGRRVSAGMLIRALQDHFLRYGSLEY